ncbi:hypothetical protein Acsp04_26240 [Actinomadura sp. NBRC 104425]|nr:hypothetical protein Acsp04_26240 [Actinomadura sp. NBRC 104425]
MTRAPRVVPPEGVDAGPVVRAIQREYPGVLAWYGMATGSWWAFVPLGQGARLVEAIDPDELREALRNPRAWPWPRARTAGLRG